MSKKLEELYAELHRAQSNLAHARRDNESDNYLENCRRAEAVVTSIMRKIQREENEQG